MKFFISTVTGVTKFAITDKKLYVHVITLSSEDTAKPLQQLDSGSKRKIS